MVWVGVGGMIGAVLRFLVSSETGGLALWIVNGTGSLALGYLTERLPDNSNWKLFLGTGVIGSFTTFSAFSAEWFEWLEYDLFAGLLYGIGMTVLCFLLCWGGMKAGRKRGQKA